MDDKKKSMSLTIDMRAIIVLLLVVIAGMLFVWKPWQENVTADRSISETGETTIKATPDEFTFNPTFEAEEADSETAKDKVAETVNKVVEKLKQIGVSEDSMTLNSYGYDDYNYWRNDDDSFTASAYLKIVVDNKDLADKVQEYLSTTSAEGQLSPNAQFSESKNKELQTQAREEAIADAKTKAQQSADLLEVKLGKAITVSEGSGFDGYYPYGGLAFAEADSAVEETRSSLPVLPGQNDFTYTVSVTFAIK